MEPMHVQCPSCGAVLSVPLDYRHSHARCAKCHHRFALPEFNKVIEETVADWLTECEEPETAEAPPPEPADEKEFVRPPEPVEHAEATSVLSAMTADIQVIKIEQRSVLFEFPSRRLRETSFRCAMPRLCLQCGTRTHLDAHVIIFTTQMVDSVSLEAEHSTGTLKLSALEARSLTGQDLLDRLPKLPNILPPGDLPMPYWLCDMCSSSGAISGQFVGDPSKDDSRCRLLVRNLQGSLEFLVAGGGKDIPGYAELDRRVQATVVSPWEQVPLVVQHRLQQWFKPEGGEHFLAYVPDRDHVRAEDGMAGLLLSNRRFIYHTKLRHRECTQTCPLELQLALGHEGGHLKIKTPEWEMTRLAVDRDGVSRLRRALVTGGFKAAWT